MTLFERQAAAVTMAVQRAVRMLGLAAIKQGEFFGLNQKKVPEQEREAA